MGKKVLLLLTFAIAGAVFVFAYSSIQKRTQGSFEILRNQGKTLLTILTQATDNAIKANEYFWESFVSRVTPVAQLTFAGHDAADAMTWLENNAPEVTAVAVYQFDDHLKLLSSAVNDSAEPHVGLQADFFEAASALLADTMEYQSLVFLPDSAHESTSALFLEIDSTRTKGVCMALDFPELWQTENDIGIGPLIQRLGEAPNVVYIFFQDPVGLVFSSTPIDSALAIESDPFLRDAYTADTLSTRIWRFQGEEVLELVKPFSSDRYPDGLFRLGVSLAVFNAAKAEFNRQMIILAVFLFLIAALIPLYLALRSERTALGISLAQTQSLSTAVLESMRSGVIAINADNSIELVNDRLREMFAIEENLRGAPDWRKTKLAKYLPGDIFERSAARLDSNVARTAQPETVNEFEATVSGDHKYFLHTVADIPATGQAKSGKALVIYDYTRQRELEAEHARRERLVELGDLAAGVAHEIRNPLNAISLAAQRLDAEFAEQIKSDRKEFSFFTGQIKEETKRLNAIVSRLLGLTREPKQTFQVVTIADALKEWIRFMQPEFERDTVSVSAETDTSVRARLDKDKLRQALNNLYRNSVEAFVESRTSSPEQTGKLRINITVLQADGVAKILVTDNGPGVPSSIVEKLFTPYFTTRPEGSGLGLSISYRLIADMGGRLELDATYDSGARFTMTFPIA